MDNFEELLKSKDAEIEMLRNICATLKTALNMELKFQRNNAKSLSEFRAAPQLKKEEPIKIYLEVKPKTSDEIFAERIARAIAFRQTMDNSEKDMQMKSQMQTLKSAIELSRQFKQHDLLKVKAKANALIDTKDCKELVKSTVKSYLFKCSSETKLFIALKKEISRREYAKNTINKVANHEVELPTPTENFKSNVDVVQLWKNRDKFAKAIAKTQIVYKSKLAIALNKEIVRREFHKSFNYSSVSYFAKKTSFPALF
jgi:hypothetical protein